MINYFSEDINLPSIDLEKTSIWLNQVSNREDYLIQEINYIFCSDQYLLDINIKHLHHDYYTDIITFPLNDRPIKADIFISLDRVKDNADTLKQDYHTELMRVIVHGLLHLCGYDDKDEEAKGLMRKKENESIKLLN